ncbi:MAG: alpha/beta hydrolase [Chryseolinea sp.]
MEQHELQFQFKSRYFKLGKLDASTTQLWFVIHGYGQLAEFFIRKFKILEDQNICVIAPEGLSHFYLEDVTSRAQTGNNRVGASWMTKENRLSDIENYLEYLNSIFEKEVGVNTSMRITILGFSQGAATASRWISAGKINFQRLILWAGIFPPDIDFNTTKGILKDKETYLVYGKSDPFINDARIAEMETLITQLGISPETKVFEGKHDIDAQTLLTFL